MTAAKDSRNTPPASCYIVTLKYAPGHKTLLAAFAHGYESVTGVRPRLILSRSYEWMFSAEEAKDIIFWGTSNKWGEVAADSLRFLAKDWLKFSQMLRNDHPEHMYICSPHPLNLAFIRLARSANPECRILNHIHEPKAYRGVKREVILQLKERVVEAVQRPAITQSDDLIVSSRMAEAALSSIVSNKSIHRIPLLSEDYATREKRERKYFTYIGSLNVRRGIRRFLQLAEACNLRAIDAQFQIVSRDNLRPYLAGVSESTIGRLRIVNRDRITNHEIGEALRESIACMILYDFPMMQSGVVPAAMMAGTPVICYKIGGMVEHLTQYKNAVMLDLGDPVEKLVEAVCYARDHQSEMEEACRSTFESVFSELNWPRYYRWLFEEKRA